MDREPVTGNVLTHPGGCGRQGSRTLRPTPSNPSSPESTAASTRRRTELSRPRSRTRRVSRSAGAGIWQGSRGSESSSSCLTTGAERASWTLTVTALRHPRATLTQSQMVELLDRQGIVAYWVSSRRGRGAHVWILFDAPGVPADDLRALPRRGWPRPTNRAWTCGRMGHATVARSSCRTSAMS